jgi:hypothetical protein
MWYGMQHGVNNKITHYKVFLYEQEEPPYIESIMDSEHLLDEVTVDHVDGEMCSAKLTIPTTATRGWWTFCKVETYCENENYGEKHPSFPSKGWFLINTPPEEPIITAA